ncbi:Synaptic vesicle glycoprotein 2B [Frankliniella fusca]|uniref:Synaptic vesicle glycoprotein 2B n=1 Tax=Frankliniella fusca TaxID=407009 RepID=A0AAE1L991_9NEOP|nr:Synaptic vesicle glycoprotein 2B [Frankliniella fusca]
MTKFSVSVAEPDDQKSKTATVEDAIEQLGTGFFHWVLVVATGMCSACAVAEAMCPSYLFSPAAWATCDLDMDANLDKSLLSAIVFAGMLAGTWLWGVAADTWGRVPLLRLTLLADAAVGVLSSFSPDKRIFIAARFFTGFLVAGPTSTAMAYLGEYHSEKTRAKALVVFGLFPGGASLVVAAVAYLVLPLELSSWSLPWLGAYRSWRLFILMCAMPSLLTGLAFLVLPESPRFLLATGRADEALQALRWAYARNKGSGKEFPVTALVTPVESTAVAGGGGALLGLLKQTVRLFGKQHIRNTLILCTVLFVVISSANGLLVWMPEIFNRMASYSKLDPDTPATACEAIYAVQAFAANSSAAAANATQVCGGVLEDAMFINTGMVGASNIVVALLSIVVVGFMGKKLLLIVCLVLAAIFCLLTTVVPSEVTTIVFACGLISLTSICISIAISVAVENYPTTLRATACSMGMLAGRGGSFTGSLVFGMLLDTQCSAGFWGLGIALLVSGALSLLLPRRGLYAT